MMADTFLHVLANLFLFQQHIILQVGNLKIILKITQVQALKESLKITQGKYCGPREILAITKDQDFIQNKCLKTMWLCDLHIIYNPKTLVKKKQMYCPIVLRNRPNTQKFFPNEAYGNNQRGVALSSVRSALSYGNSRATGFQFCISFVVMCLH